MSDQWLNDWVDRVGEWTDVTFKDEAMVNLALLLGEESSELVETLELTELIIDLVVRVGKIERAALKESHGANDRRADTDWQAERYKEIGDVMITLAKIVRRDGIDMQQCLEDRLAYVVERFPRAIT